MYVLRNFFLICNNYNLRQIIINDALFLIITISLNYTQYIQ